jgi:hypothetical protein
LRSVPGSYCLTIASISAVIARSQIVVTTSAERMRALRERKSRGLRRLTIEVSEDDLRAIAARASSKLDSLDDEEDEKTTKNGGVP